MVEYERQELGVEPQNAYSGADVAQIERVARRSR